MTAPRQSRSTRGWRALQVVGVVGALTIVTACGDTESDSLCPRFEAYQQARERAATRLDEIADTAATAEEALEEVEAYLGSIRVMRVAADGRFADQIDALEESVSNIQRTLAGVDPEETYDIWAPLVLDDVEAAQTAADRVVGLIEPQCTPPDQTT